LQQNPQKDSSKVILVINVTANKNFHINICSAQVGTLYSKLLKIFRKRCEKQLIKLSESA